MRTAFYSSSESPWPSIGVRFAPIATLGLITLALFFISLSVGAVSIPFADVIKVLTGGAAEKTSWETIILTFRLPKAITAVLVGAALATSGLQMQTLFRNPLADPFVLGISSGASLGVAIIVLGAGTFTALLDTSLLSRIGVVGAASIGSALVLGGVLVVSRRLQSMVTLLVLGLMSGYATSALVSILMYFSLPQQVQAFMSWGFGSFGGVTWDRLMILAPTVLAGLFLAYRLMKPLNALLLGEHYAASMGLDVRRSRWAIIASASLLAGATTAFCGPIAFVGVAVPHLLRGMLNTADHRVLLPASEVAGGAMALLFDIVSQLPGNHITLPINAVSALVGAPIVMWVILRRPVMR